MILLDFLTLLSFQGAPTSEQPTYDGRLTLYDGALGQPLPSSMGTYSPVSGGEGEGVGGNYTALGGQDNPIYQSIEEFNETPQSPQQQPQQQPRPSPRLPQRQPPPPPPHTPPHTQPQVYAEIEAENNSFVQGTAMWYIQSQGIVYNTSNS